MRKLNLTSPIPAEKDSGEDGEVKGEFDYENWKSWTPEEWIKWSNSKEYKDKYLNVLNPYKVRR